LENKKREKNHSKFEFKKKKFPGKSVKEMKNLPPKKG
jgi:hypothetical protein